MTADHATTIASAVERLDAGTVEGYITRLHAPHSRFHGYPRAGSGGGAPHQPPASHQPAIS